MQKVIITVEHPDEVLEAEAFGAGAVIRLESSPGGVAPWVWTEIDTTAVLADTTSYGIWDPAGTSTTYYRTRYSDAGQTLFSEYSETFLAGTAGPLLTVDELRLHITSSLTDEALQLLLDAAYAAIEETAVPIGSVTELITPGYGDLVMLARKADSITSVIEGTTTLAADDYELRSSGRVLRRLSTGTNAASYWLGRLDVTYAVPSDMAERKRVQLELVKLDLAFSPTLASQTIGTWKEDYATDKPYADQRDEILASLSTGSLAV